MTIDEIKERLPDVKIRVGKGIQTCKLAGRCNPYAMGHLKMMGIDIAFTVAWSTVQRHLETGNPLIY